MGKPQFAAVHSENFRAPEAAGNRERKASQHVTFTQSVCSIFIGSTLDRCVGHEVVADSALCSVFVWYTMTLTWEDAA